MAPPVALVTGGSSGIGLALANHLLSKFWSVILADLNPPKEDIGPNAKFIRCDVASWDSQAALFSTAYTWHDRLDFCALNAGIDDRDDIFNSISHDPAKPPPKPNMATLDIDLVGVYYGIKLAAHYLCLPSSEAAKPKAGGKIVVTASAAGIYPIPQCPQYGMAKHGLVGLVSLAPRAKEAGVGINAVCPALVRTGLAPSGLLDSFKEEQFTPMSTMMRRFDELADFDAVGNEAWVERGKAGETVEGNLDKLIWYRAPPRPDSTSHQDEEGIKSWDLAYRQRNVDFVEKA